MQAVGVVGTVSFCTWKTSPFVRSVHSTLGSESTRVVTPSVEGLECMSGAWSAVSSGTWCG